MDIKATLSKRLFPISICVFLVTLLPLISLAAVKKAKTTVSLSASDTSITAGQSAKLSGKLKQGKKVLAKKKVKIKAGSKVVKTVTTNKKGSFSLNVSPTGTTTYKAVFAGSKALKAASSKSVTVTVSSSPNDPGSGTFTIASTAYNNNGTIPTKYANTGITGGQNTSIPYSWSSAPSGTQSFALLMVDRSAGNFVHWMVINIPSSTTSLAEGASASAMPAGSSQINNGFGTNGYGGPEPPSGTHSYETIIYALNTNSISLSQSASLTDFNNTISGKVLAQASITGLFSAN